MDVVKSIAQKQTGQNTAGMISIMKSIVLQKGILGLYAGLGPRIMRVGMDRAFGFFAFDTLANWMTAFPIFREVNTVANIDQKQNIIFLEQHSMGIYFIAIFTILVI